MHITRVLLLGARVCLADVVIGELFQGVRTAQERAIIEEFTNTLPTLAGTPTMWKAAGQLVVEARGRDRTVHLIDSYLACLAKEHRASLLTCDRHFETFHTFLPQLHIDLISA